MSGYISNISRRHNILWRKIEEDRRFNGKKWPKRKKIIDISAGQHRSMRYNVPLQCTLVNALQCSACTLKNVSFLCHWGDSNPKQKVWNSAHQTTKANLPFIKCIALKIYIQSHHVKKILKEYFKEQINYNYCIIKYKNLF